MWRATPPVAVGGPRVIVGVVVAIWILLLAARPGRPDEAGPGRCVRHRWPGRTRHRQHARRGDLPPDPLDVIRQQRALGRSDHSTAGLLNAAGCPPPPGGGPVDGAPD